jgi:hypothetical protein
MLRAAACGAILLLGCPDRIESSEPTANIATSPAEGRVIDLSGNGGQRAGSDGAPRELHPREGRDGCIEMYTVCLPEKAGQNCTSARLDLECNESGRIPPTREPVKCVCP